MSEPLNELITIPSESALEVFTKPDAIAPYLEQIKQAVTGHVPDLSTAKGRKEVASLAFKVAKSKTYLDSAGKALVDEYKEIPRKIDATRKQARDYLDALRDEVRQPLTDWEDAEKARAAKHEAAIAQLADTTTEGMTAAEIGARIQALDVCDIGTEWEEFEAEAHRVKAASLSALREAMDVREKYEAEQAELAELRRKQVEQEQRDREAAIAREATERAQREAEARAQAERQQSEQRERELMESAERAEREKEDAERRALAAQQQAEQAEQRAKEEAERQYLAEQRRLAEETMKREADRDHRKAINTAALDAFVEGGLNREAAKMAVTLIAKRQIPAVMISY